MSFVPFLRGGMCPFCMGDMYILFPGGEERVGMKKLSRRAVSSDL